MADIYFNILYETKYSPKKRTVYYVVEGKASVTLDAFKEMTSSQQKRLKNILTNLAEMGNKYKNSDIKPLKGCSKVFQIRIDQNRFFYFSLVDEHIILFDHLLKKKNTIQQDIYRTINKKKEEYERKFIS